MSAEETPFDGITWIALLYLWSATEPFDIGDSLARECRSQVREEIAAALWRKVPAGDADHPFALTMLKHLKVPQQKGLDHG